MDKLQTLIMKIYFVLTVPLSIMFIFNSKKIYKQYNMNIFRKFMLGIKMFRNSIFIPTATSYKSHLAMALKILETPPTVPGDIIECGTYKGGSAANLSLVCRIVGRKLKIYDSFEGLPEGNPSDRQAEYYKKGDYCGAMDEVRSNIEKYGAIECCEFIKGWFDHTMPLLNYPVLLAFLDVDLEESLDTCVRYIWPNLVDEGYIFIDECVGIDYCSLFYSEKWWGKYFDRKPPGLIGAGIGLALGDYYIGPHSERHDHPMQHANTGAYTRKDMTGYWAYYSDES